MVSFPSFRAAHEGSVALLILAGSLFASSPALGSEPTSGQQRPTTEGRTVQTVQYRQALRPVYSTLPAPVRAAAPAVTLVAPTFTAPLMAAQVFTQPLMTAANAWQPATTYVQQQPATTYVQQQPAMTYIQQQPAATAAPAASYGGDPYGFTAWLNSVRSSYGLGAVAFDANLTNWAASNNAAQQARGMGHHVMGPARRQNSAIGSAATIGSQWMNSPAHRAALLDPTIRAIGIAGAGMYWTFNAY